MIHALYRALSIAGGPLIDVFLKRRMLRGKEDPARAGERRGLASLDRPDGPLVWLHAASVGESLSLLPLIERLVDGGRLRVLVTTGTVTSARLMAERLPAGAVHQFVPVDRPAWVRRFLDHWRPGLVLWAESDFWPNLLAEIGKRHVPLILVQGRMSARSFAGWSRAPGFIARVLADFTLCLGQTPADVQRLVQLGARDARCLGNLKLAVPPLPYEPAELAALKAQIGDRPVWLASSTHPGEEAVAARVHRTLAERLPGLLTIIVPRHPERGPEVLGEVKALGLQASLRSAGEAPDRAILVADTMGELGLFYRLAPVVFMGKSLTVEGGQNPFEPARLGAAVLFGPRMSNFPDMAPAMLAADAACQVADQDQLAEAVGRLLADPAAARAMGARALAWAEAEAGSLDQVMGALAPFIAAVEAGDARP
ncbi:3-deoxy-D-manno-octulosonic-acid transferase (KDO transferase) [Magnetospirillum sp. LM-5]|uniref:3-deoxy-D-manno-octulosonic acid transferase n=1 Tax=Magnetospirillum sp. LM-5 TaxID=2681466 RepID=UPI0013844773|nr:3-deoxy-D-manno-octulosonic acid transferase [Magnetospirillum sp. LM-5]CAA7618000.1 3-deoxy-D-manno-octulosonic-acid transferase (KDO transferase) [Magnetospirillum sp. LM-5]